MSNITYKIVIACTGIGAYIPVGCRINGSVEGESAVHVPIAIDILGPRDATARLRIVAYKVRDGVAYMAIIGINYDGAFVACDVVVIVEIQRVGELRL